MMLDVLVLLFAVAFDLAAGEMPAVLHPVVWMGRLLRLGVLLGPRRGKAGQFIYGAALVFFVILLFGGAAFTLMRFLRTVNPAVYVVAGGILLKSCFSIRELARAAKRVKESLLQNDIPQARVNVRSLVSRETASLDAPAIVGAAVESVAENTSDSFVAPIFWFVLLGIPGAFIYRVANTADAMIGYHDDFEYLGKFAARLDDVLNFVPARATGLLLVAASWVSRLDVGGAWHIMLRDHGLTESWNAGWPMSAMAGSLNVRLEKAAHYKLGDAVKALTPQLIDDSVRVMSFAVAIWLLAAIGLEGVLGAIGA
ncbi:MAG: cobalamin biosynthesis protein [Dehalococcoidia bacterium]|nr:cobalamin biosynthesis protein [Dehalococcoidia bacterium]